MNEHDRSTLERLLEGQAEHKKELVNIGLHLERLNGSVGQHFADDLAWQQAHDRREVARDLAVIEAAAERAVEVAEAKGYRRGLMLPIAAVIALLSLTGGAAGTVIAKILGY